MKHTCLQGVPSGYCPWNLQGAGHAALLSTTRYHEYARGEEMRTVQLRTVAKLRMQLATSNQDLQRKTAARVFSQRLTEACFWKGISIYKSVGIMLYIWHRLLLDPYQRINGQTSRNVSGMKHCTLSVALADNDLRPLYATSSILYATSPLTALTTRHQLQRPDDRQ